MKIEEIEEYIEYYKTKKKRYEIKLAKTEEQKRSIEDINYHSLIIDYNRLITEMCNEILKLETILNKKIKEELEKCKKN